MISLLRIVLLVNCLLYMYKYMYMQQTYLQGTWHGKKYIYIYSLVFTDIDCETVITVPL